MPESLDNPADSPAESPARGEQLRIARQRLTRLEAETHRLRAELAKLEASGEEAAAERLEAQLRQHEDDLAQELQVDQPSAPSLTPSRAPSPAAEPPATKTDAPGQADDRRDPRGKKRSQRPLAKPAAAMPKPTKRRRVPAWVVSLGVHIAMVLALGLVSFATLTEAPRLLLASSAGDERLDDFTPIDFDQAELEELDAEALSEFDTPELTEIDLAESSPLAAVESIVAPAALDALPTDTGTLMAGLETGGGEGQGAGEGRGRGGGRRGGAKFFGAKAEGGRFVFVVDNSGSMQDGRLETTLMELERSVAQMSAEQSFYVIFYSDQAYPMFFPDGAAAPVAATRDNKQRLSRWLPTVEMCVGGRLIDAMKLAESMEPDTVFLLSDGVIGSGVMRYMTDPSNDWPFVVNTFGMTVPDQQAAANLMAIASARRGRFAPVGVNPRAAQVSQQRPIRYWNTRSGPGPVWGTKVRKATR